MVGQMEKENLTTYSNKPDKEQVTGNSMPSRAAWCTECRLQKTPLLVHLCLCVRFGQRSSDGLHTALSGQQSGNFDRLLPGSFTSFKHKFVRATHSGVCAMAFPMQIAQVAQAPSFAQWPIVLPLAARQSFQHLQYLAAPPAA